ncbi:hypothetical protein ACHAWO_010538 [Cyclotella atomus]|uniref:Uncharacterized protein n=1 Tax=Cyclotella atomus TaxID=382360 RepID=A0ABD3NWZ8_9STRA
MKVARPRRDACGMSSTSESSGSKSPPRCGTISWIRLQEHQQTYTSDLLKADPPFKTTRIELNSTREDRIDS